MAKTRKKIDLSKLTPEELLKYEIAAELGVFDKVMQEGWQSLTAKETGKIGGLVAKRKKRKAAGDSSFFGAGKNEKDKGSFE